LPFITDDVIYGAIEYPKRLAPSPPPLASGCVAYTRPILYTVSVITNGLLECCRRNVIEILLKRAIVRPHWGRTDHFRNILGDHGKGSAYLSRLAVTYVQFRINSRSVFSAMHGRPSQRLLSSRLPSVTVNF